MTPGAGASAARPRIALTWPGAARAKSRPGPYLEAVTAAGGEPVLVTPEAGLAPLAGVSAVLLTGGRDLHPRHYGQALDERVGETVDVDPERDALELQVIAWIRERDIPTLGICRGVQMLNAAFGGTLTQDVSLLGIERAAHDQRGSGLEDWEARHQVRVEPDSRLAQIFGTTVLDVNSFHHQVARDAAPALRVVAQAADGLIEGLEAPGPRFLIGVQWHPERMAGRVVQQRAIFDAFVAAAREYTPAAGARR